MVANKTAVWSRAQPLFALPSLLPLPSLRSSVFDFSSSLRFFFRPSAHSQALDYWLEYVPSRFLPQKASTFPNPSVHREEDFLGIGIQKVGTSDYIVDDQIKVKYQYQRVIEPRAPFILVFWLAGFEVMCLSTQRKSWLQARSLLILSEGREAAAYIGWGCLADRCPKAK